MLGCVERRKEVYKILDNLEISLISNVFSYASKISDNSKVLPNSSTIIELQNKLSSAGVKSKLLPAAFLIEIEAHK